MEARALRIADQNCANPPDLAASALVSCRSVDFFSVASFSHCTAALFGAFPSAPKLELLT